MPPPYYPGICHPCTPWYMCLPYTLGRYTPYTPVLYTLLG